MSADDSFRGWQPEYAESRIATFPVRIIETAVGVDKVPMIKQYQRIGLRGSTELASKFGGATALGFLLGRHNNLMFADVDSCDERAVADVLSDYGDSPVISRTASKGGFHVWYRFNEAAWQHYNGGKCRAIKPDLDRPVDYLAAGYAVGPPSIGPKGRYEFIRVALTTSAN